jgi:serine/threonine protein kinase
MKILTEEPIAPSKIATDLLPHIDQVILKALSKDPSKRYSNVQEFRDELKNISDFRSRYAVQPMKMGETKSEKYYYNQISINSYSDLVKHSKMLPEAGQERLLYEIEMLFHKYMEEYKDQITHKNNAVSLSDTTDDIDESYLSFESHIDVEEIGNSTSGFIDSFNYVIPKLTKLGSDSLKGMSISMDFIIFLGKVNGTSTLKQFFDTNYPEKIHDAFNQVYNCVQKNFLTLEIKDNPKSPILIGDMMIILHIVTKFQLDFALNKKKTLDGTPNSKLIGEILLESGYLTRDKLLHVLKLQHWYRRLFG